jgi:Fe2+ transport system protein B
MKRLKTFLANAAIHSAVWLSLVNKIAFNSQGAANLLLAWSWFLAILTGVMFVAALFGFRDKERKPVPETALYRLSASAWIVTGYWHGDFFFATATACFCAMVVIVSVASDNNPGKQD